MDSKNFPIIIPVKNRLQLTKQTIDTIIANSLYKHSLFIVSDNSTQDVNDYLLSLKEVNGFTFEVHIFNEDQGPGKTRNKAMELAGVNDFYYHTDCDMYFDKDWDEKLYNAYLSFYPEIGVLGGRKHPHHGEQGREERDGYQVIFSDQQVGMSMFFSFDVWYKIQAFKENRPDEMGAEDTEFCNMVKSHGYKIASLANTVVYHCGIKNTWNNNTAGHNEELKQQFPSDAIFL